MSSQTPEELVPDYDTSRPLTEEKLVNNLREFKRSLGHVPTSREMNASGPHHASTYHNHFDGWNDALSAAGFEPPNSYNGTDEGNKSGYSESDVVRALRSWTNQNGSPPTKREFEEDGPFSTAPVSRHFGSWNRGLEAAGVSIRCPGPESRSGEDNPMWSGGGPKYYGPSWKPQRKKCLERDGYECARCGTGSDEHMKMYSQDLHVHHIRRFRSFENHEDANDLDNLITLCRSCHNRLEGLPIDTR